jgi:hypothetical protein
MVIDVIFTSPDPKGGSCEAMSSLCSLSVSDSQRVMWGHVITMQPVSVRHPKGHVRSCHHYATCQCQTLKGSCEVMSSLCNLSVSDTQRVMWGHVITMQPVSVRLSKGHVRSCHHYAACQCQTQRVMWGHVITMQPVSVRLSKGHVRSCHHYAGLSVSDSQTHMFLST